MIVCIHGLFTSPAFWEPVADRLSATHRVLRFSLPGFGDSEKPAQGTFQYRTADFVRILADIVSPPTEERNVTLLSHAHGASLALAFAQEFPVFLKSAVLVSPSVFAPPGALTVLETSVRSFVLKQLVGESLFVMLQSKDFD